ncbi:MAG TPA: sigma-70 family RNA polymerase sigma factor [Terracidiphilus sp.]
MDTVPLQPADAAERPPGAVETSHAVASVPRPLLDELWRTAGGAQIELTADEFAHALAGVGARRNFGMEPAAVVTVNQREKYWRGLHLADLALAHACALGRDRGWQQFMAQYRAPLMKAAVAMTRSEALGEELATALCSELFGLTEREGVRWSPLSTYSGQGSLMGWLRAMLAQRQVNQFRKTHRETVLGDVEVAANPDAAHPEEQTLRLIGTAIAATLEGLDAEERFLLRAYYLDRHTLLEISRVLRVHEATVSRQLKRAVKEIRRQLLSRLRASGLNRRAAEDALGTDPRDIDVNLQKLLQNPAPRAISEGKGSA